MTLRLGFYASALAALAIGLAGVTLLTELGQLLNLPRDWVFNYFHYRVELSILMLALAATAVAIHWRQALQGKWLQRSLILVVAGCLFIVNWFVPYVWLRSEQHDAVFISVAEADKLLADSEDILVLEVNGDARAYPREWMQLPHFAGQKVGGEAVVMTYCALSDLPQAFSTDFDGHKADYRVIAQVNNNLIFTDTESGELFQQITGRGEYSGLSARSYPVQRMPWSSFKTLYPQGQVFYTQPNLLDKLTQFIFAAGLQSHYSGEPLFPTLRMDDDRLPPGEPVWGLSVNNESIAVARSAFNDSNVRQFTLGGRSIAATWYPELQMIAAFYAEIDDRAITVEAVDPYGVSTAGQLERVSMYPGVRWMVWSHWFPDTQLVN